MTSIYDFVAKKLPSKDRDYPFWREVDHRSIIGSYVLSDRVKIDISKADGGYSVIAKVSGMLYELVSQVQGHSQDALQTAIGRAQIYAEHALCETCREFLISPRNRDTGGSCNRCLEDLRVAE